MSSFFFCDLCIYREAIGFDFLKSVTQLFEGSSDVGKAILLHIELLLQRKKEPLAKKMIEDITASWCHASLNAVWYSWVGSGGSFQLRKVCMTFQSTSACDLNTGRCTSLTAQWS